MPLQTVAFPVDEFHAIEEVMARADCSQSEAFRLGLQALHIGNAHTLQRALHTAKELKRGRSRKGELATARLRTTLSYPEAEHPLIAAAVARVRALTGCSLRQTSQLFRLGIQVLRLLDQQQIEELERTLLRRKRGRPQQNMKIPPLSQLEMERLFNSASGRDVTERRKQFEQELKGGRIKKKRR